MTRWSQIPIWDPSADDSDRHSYVNAERIPQGMRPGKDSGPSGGRTLPVNPILFFTRTI